MKEAGYDEEEKLFLKSLMELMDKSGEFMSMLHS